MKRIREEQKLASNHVWGAILLTIGAFLLMFVEASIKQSAEITGIIFLLTITLIFIGFRIHLLGMIRGINPLFQKRKLRK